MALDMFDGADISEAIRLAVQSKVKLAGDCDGSATVTLGSTELFRSTGTSRGDWPITGLTIAATLNDNNSDAENVVIIEITNESTLVLYAACAGTFTVAQEAVIGLTTPRLTLGASAAVTEGPFPAAMDIAAAAFPTIAVIEVGGVQGLATNKQYDQVRTYRVLYARHEAAGEESEQVLQAQTQILANLLMEDPALNNTVRSCYVTAWEYFPAERVQFDQTPIQVAALTLTVDTWALWDK